MNVPALMSRVLAVVAAQQRRRGLRWYLLVDPTLPARLQGDTAPLEQVLARLALDTVAATGGGIVVLGATLRLRRRERVLLRLSVSDGGAGVPLDRLGRAATRRAAIDAPDGASGVSAEMNRLLDHHGVQLRTASIRGNGAVSWFDLTLPVEEEVDPASTPADTVVFSADRRLIDTVAAQWRAQGQALLPTGDAVHAARWIVDTALPDADLRADEARRLGRTLHLVSAEPGHAAGAVVELPRLSAAAFG